MAVGYTSTDQAWRALSATLADPSVTSVEFSRFGMPGLWHCTIRRKVVAHSITGTGTSADSALSDARRMVRESVAAAAASKARS